MPANTRGYGNRKRGRNVDQEENTQSVTRSKRGRKKKEQNVDNVETSSPFICQVSSSRVGRPPNQQSGRLNPPAKKSSSRTEKRNKRHWDDSENEDDLESQSTFDIERESTTIKSEISEEDSAIITDLNELDTSDDVLFSPWVELDESQIEPLVLPCSSSDLLIESEHLFDALEIYEILRRYYRTIQLSPFLFEDFCCALRSTSQSNLLCEIHIALLRLLIRDDEEQQTTFVSIDLNPSFNALYQMLESMTFSEVLRQYVESDKRFSKEVLEILQKTDYPFVELDKRLVVLKWLCGQFLESTIFKNLIKNGETFEHDRICRQCGKSGILLNCSGCEASYHLSCIELKKFPEEDWFCTICNYHRGITGSAEEKFPLRRLPIGFDRHGRIYWFLTRRIFVQDLTKNEVYYYSTLPQIYDLVSELDHRFYEVNLCKKLTALMPSIAIQMHETLELTDRRREDLQERAHREFPQPYIHIDNSHRMSYIISRLQQTEDTDFENDDDELDSEGNWTHHGIVKQVRHLLCIEEGHLVAPFWSGNLNEEYLLQYNKQLEENIGDVGSVADSSYMYKDYLNRAQKGFRLGYSDGEYRQYVNHYTNSEFSKSFALRTKEKERRKNLNARFGLIDEMEFSWETQKQQDCFGIEPDLLRCMKLSLVKLIESLPDELMHRLWMIGKKTKFLQQLTATNTLEGFKMLLLLYERALRKPIFSTMWWNCLGHTRLMRITTEERERRHKIEQLKKRDEKMDVIDETELVWVKYTLLGGPPKHNIWKMKDEQYRVNGIGSLGGWIWVSNTMKRNIKPLPSKAPLNIRFGVPRSMLNTPEAKKVYKLERLVKRFTLWRIIEEYAKVKEQKNYFCYSPSCRFVCSGSIFAIRASCPVDDSIMPCYSSTCLRNNWDNFATKTKEIVSCKNVIRIKTNEQKQRSKEVPGEGIPFSFPIPYEFKSKRTERRSLLILPKSTLHKLARQGGLNPDTFIPGFSRIAKINNTVWPYPCSRPLFDQCWRYMTITANTHHAIALRFKQLFYSIRWSDLNPDENDEDPRVWSHLPDYDEVRTVIGHKEHPPDGYYEQYKIKVDQYLFEEEGDVAEEDGDDSISYRIGVNKQSRRKRKSKKGPVQRKVVTTERWIDGVDLKLYEMVDYWKQYFKEQKEKALNLVPVPIPPSQIQRQNHIPAAQKRPQITISNHPQPPIQQSTTRHAATIQQQDRIIQQQTQQITPIQHIQQQEPNYIVSAAPQRRVVHMLPRGTTVLQPAQQIPQQQRQIIVHQQQQPATRTLLAPMLNAVVQQQPQHQTPVVQIQPTVNSSATIVTLPEGIKFAPGTTFKFIYAPQKNEY